MAMNSSQIAVDLYDGWSCLLNFKRAANGRVGGIEEIAFLDLSMGYVVIMSQLSLDTAVARTRLRGSRLVSARTSTLDT